MLELVIIRHIEDGKFVAVSLKTYKALRLEAQYLKSVIVDPRQLPEGKSFVLMGDFTDAEALIWRGSLQAGRS